MLTEQKSKDQNTHYTTEAQEITVYLPAGGGNFQSFTKVVHRRVYAGENS